MTEQQMHEYAKLLVSPGWVDVDIYPFSDEAYERLWQELKEDHEQGKHKVHHYIDCIDCRKEYNNETF